jgi:ATP-dependent DNA helicase RecQ
LTGLSKEKVADFAEALLKILHEVEPKEAVAACP